jgi:hypothetical protein
VPEAEEGGAKVVLQYVEVIEDTEGTEPNPADEGNTWCINLSDFEILCTYLWLIVHLHSGVDMKPMHDP